MSITRLALLLTFTVNVCLAQTYSPSDITDLVLVTGQSNVQGSQTDTDPLIDTVHERVFAYRLDPFSRTEDWEIADLRQAWDVNGWHPGNGTLQCEADPATCTTPPNTPYNNFAFHFAKSVAEADPGRVVGIIVASAPGEGIKHWDAGGEFQRKIASKVSAALNAQGVKTKLDGILWHQGETDWLIEGTSDPDATDDESTEINYYPRKLSTLINNFRANQWFGEGRPFICGETRAADLNVHLTALNSDGDAWTGCVQGSDLSTRDEQTHFDAKGLRTIGQRYGEKYLAMTGFLPKQSDNVPPETIIKETTTTAFGTTISGHAKDTGLNGVDGSGFSNVRIALKNTSSNYWLNFATGTFTTKFEATNATLENNTASRTDWTLTVDLLPGSYKVFAIATDTEGNYKRTVSGGRLYTTASFQIAADSQPPEIEIETPDTNELVLGDVNFGVDVNFGGTATAFGGTDIIQVRIAIRDLSSGNWYDEANSSFSSSFKHTLATVTESVNGAYDWSYSLPLAAGNYKFFANPIDSAGNFPTNANGSRDYQTIRFSVSGDTEDSTPPTTAINTPQSDSAEDLILHGTASDTGGSGLAHVRIALKNTLENTWYDFTQNEFVDSFQHGRAAITLTDNDNATWATSAELTAGRYKFFALAEDNNANYVVTATGSRKYQTVVFEVE